MFNTLLAFIRRDFLITISYRAQFLLHFLDILITTSLFYYIALLFGKNATTYLESYGGDYFSFVLIGIAFSRYLQFGLSSFSNTVRRDQMTGTLEALLVTPIKISNMILYSSIWNFLYTSIQVLIYLVLGAFLFGVNINNANMAGALVILFLTIIAFSSLGILSASFVLLFKEGDPINYIFRSASQLFGGVYFPISILPQWMQYFSYIMPITYSLDGMRLAILKGYTIQALGYNIIALSLFSIVLLPISIIVFKYAVKRAKIDGTLVQY